MTEAPSAWQVEQVFATWQSARARILHDDPSLDGDEAALAELLGSLEGDIETLLRRAARAAVHAQAMEEAAKKREDEIGARKKRYATRKAALRALTFTMLEAMGKRSYELEDMTLAITSGKQSVRIVDEATVPNIYVEEVTVRNIDKVTILSVLKSGGKVPGAELSNGLESLIIRKT